MENNYTLLYSIGTILYTLAKLSILVGSILIFIKRKSLSSYVILFGSSLMLIGGLVGFIATFLASRNSSESIIITNGIISIVNSGAFLLFAIGILLLGVEKLKNA